MRTDRECYYFRHYADARNDPKIIRLLIKHGMEGYGIFWSMLEMLRTAKEYTIEYDPEVIAHQLSINCDTIKSVCEHCGIFNISEGNITHSSLKDFLTKRSETYRKNRKPSINQDNCSTIDNQLIHKARILKESKGKESKVNTTFKAPTPHEVSEYCKSKGYSIDSQYFCDYYETRGWLIGKNKIKNWKACISTWVKRQKENDSTIKEPNWVN